MWYFKDKNTKDQRFLESIYELKDIKKQIKKLTERKDELIHEIIDSLGHQHEGQKTYECGDFKIEVSTPFVYSLDKNRYESGGITLPHEFNPVKEYVSYSIDKRLCDKYMANAPRHVRDALVELIDKKPGKARVTIKESL